MLAAYFATLSFPCKSLNDFSLVNIISFVRKGPLFYPKLREYNPPYF